MRWRARLTGNARKLWHTWFAWFPVRVGLTWVWMESIDRREVRTHCVEYTPGLTRPVYVVKWEYRLPKPGQRIDDGCDGTEYYR